ncbi:hypothetical protein LCGC14_1836560, partial [marine sediment metagenome]
MIGVEARLVGQETEMSAKSREAEKPTPGCNLQIARMPGLTRLKCEGCGFYAAICDGP